MPITKQELIDLINQQIRQNGASEITGPILNNILKNVVELDHGVGKKIYELVNVTLAESCPVEITGPSPAWYLPPPTAKVHTVTISAKVRALKALSYFPCFIGLVTVNGKARTSTIAQFFLDSDFPITANQLSGIRILDSLKLRAADYPAHVEVYIWDTLGNYADSYQFDVTFNPCLGYGYAGGALGGGLL